MALKCYIGGKESDSFITADEADVLLEGMPDDTSEWLALTASEKEYRLRLAASLLSSLPFRGTRIYEEQALCWPRSGFGSRTIPGVVKEAQAFLAYSVIGRALANRGEVDEESPSDIASISLGGVISVSFRAGTTQSMVKAVTDPLQFPGALVLTHYLTQIRGRSVANEDDSDYPVLSTTTTTMSTTSSTHSTTTTS